MVEFVLLLLTIPGRSDAERFAKLQFFMPEHRVIEILGRPSLGKNALEPSIYDLYRTATSEELRSEGEVWRSSTGDVVIWVRFNKERLVTGMGLSRGTILDPRWYRLRVRLPRDREVGARR
jgi:hypothetical protein